MSDRLQESREVTENLQSNISGGQLLEQGLRSNTFNSNGVSEQTMSQFPTVTLAIRDELTDGPYIDLATRPGGSAERLVNETVTRRLKQDGENQSSIARK